MGILSLLTTRPVEALVFLFSIILAITVHECAHAWTAYKLGDDTPLLMGRVTLNPIAHLDPLGSLTFLLFGFGWGKPVQYNPLRLPRKVDELFIALAGPASNIILAIILSALALTMEHVSTPLIAPSFLRLAAYVNVLLAAFNVLPIPPLDGSSVVAYFFPQYRSVLGGQLGLILLLALIFLPVGNATLLDSILNPLIHLFQYITTLFGLLGSGMF